MTPASAAVPYRRDPRRFERALRRTSGAELVGGNAVHLLHNGREAFEEWLTEITHAQRWIHLENYIFRADHVGELFADALCERAAYGVAVRVLVDWFGSVDVSSSFWKRLRAAGVDLRVINPPSLSEPLAVVRRDHRKTLCVDGRYASAGGICIAEEWLDRSRETGLAYRDTAVGIRGPAVAEMERAFAGVWAQVGEALPQRERPDASSIPAAGSAPVRIVAQEPGRVRLLRLLTLLSAAAETRLWIADAYFLSVPTLHESLMTAARDGIDVRVLTPGTMDVPLVAPLARTGYTPLLEAGVQIWEYKGPMMHAKTHVIDGWSSRVGSTNLNISGLLANWELDVIVEDRAFGAEMEEMFEADLADARPVLLRPGGRLSPPPRARERARGSRRRRKGTRKTGVRAVAAAATTSSAVISGEALSRNERRVAQTVTGGLVVIAVAGARYPRLLAWPIAALAGLLGAAGLRSVLRGGPPSPSPSPTNGEGRTKEPQQSTGQVPPLPSPGEGAGAPWAW